MDDFKDQVKKGFQKCRLDIEKVENKNLDLNEKIQSFRNENEQLKSLITEMKSEMTELKAEIKGMNIAMDYIKEFNKISSENIKNNNSLEQNYQKEEKKNVNKIKSQKQYKDPYEALLAFKAKTNKRELLKQKILQILNENEMMTLSELKFLFVDHYRYCSKASFYNYLKEVELEKYIKIDRINGKNKVYLATPDIVTSKDLENEI